MRLRLKPVLFSAGFCWTAHPTNQNTSNKDYISHEEHLIRAHIKISNNFKEIQIIICLCLYGFQTGQSPGSLQSASTKCHLHTYAYHVVEHLTFFSDRFYLLWWTAWRIYQVANTKWRQRATNALINVWIRFVLFFLIQVPQVHLTVSVHKQTKYITEVRYVHTMQLTKQLVTLSNGNVLHKTKIQKATWWHEMNSIQISSHNVGSMHSNSILHTKPKWDRKV